LWCAELGVDEVGATSTFFELGGHSLTAVRLVNRIRSELGVELGVLDFLRAPTVRGLVAHLAPPGDTGEDAVVRTAPASHGQRFTYRLTHSSDTPSVLTIATRFTLRGHLDHDALRDALTALAKRHPTLRTRYRRDGDDLWQEVLAPRPVPLPAVEVTEADLDAAVLDWATRPFDLDGEAGVRAVLFTVSAEVAELLVAVHHSLSDGWSTTVLIRDLGELYRAALTGGEPELPALTADYLDFAHWEQEYLADPTTREAVAAWAAQARRWGAEPLRLPVDRPRADRVTGGGEVIRVDLSPSLTERVAAVAAERDTTPFAVLLAVFAGLCHELTGSAVVASLCQMANRGEARFEDVVGLFTHTAWLMVRVADADSFDELVTRATEAIWQRMELQAIPQATQNEELGGPFWPAPPRVLFGLFNWAMPALELEGVDPAAPGDVDLPVARAEQTWNLIATDDGGMMLQVEYATQLFDAATMASWTQRYVDLLTSSLAAPDTRTWR
jgi:acyl carrier protein